MGVAVRLLSGLDGECKISHPTLFTAVLLLNIPADVLLPGLHSLWHAYRIPILFLLPTIGLTVKIAVYSLQSRNKSDLSSVSGSPAPRDRKADVAGSTGTETLRAEGKKQNETPSETIRVQTSVPVSLPSIVLRPPKRIRGKKQFQKRAKSVYRNHESAHFKVDILVFFASLTGQTESYAKVFVDSLYKSLALSSSKEKKYGVHLHNLSEIDPDDYFVSPPRSSAQTKYFYLFLIPTYDIDTILTTLLTQLQETHHDFRIDTAPLSLLLGYAVFGFGDQEGWPTEEDGFCSQARQLDKWLARLTGGKRAFPLGMGDVKTDANQRFDEWKQGVGEVIRDIGPEDGLGEGVVGSGNAVESDEEAAEMEEDDEGIVSSSTAQAKRRQRQGVIDDVEEIGRTVQVAGDEAGPPPVDFTARGTVAASTKEMVPRSSPTYAALTKQGYTIVGSHSGVKICRWTKSALRGRGSCYKFSFYGIKSHLCMETTPSLSCSNKCVFCWRHGTNPVSTTWRWKVDPPEMIVEGAKEGHYQKIRMMRGVPGVRADRFAEAFRIRHCALSLVGEPIFYPHINRFTALLHQERISTFLVCNAQHPDQLAALKPVTQLYVSIDASNRESLRRIDRPLHRDFWERFQRCLDILREKRFRQRTVFRLTLVKGFNIDEEVQGYADLVAKALPCFVEIKGVTFCGTSTSSSMGLTMANVPFYSEITAFVRALDDELAHRGLEYGIAAEHAHSCCVLIASKRFLVDGRWHTIIDYDGFFELLAAGGEFAPEDYMGPSTPEWALWGNGGFDPADQRVYRKKKG